jgi:hypothetical protein
MAAPAAGSTATLPPLLCQPLQTGGFHDYPEGEEVYEPALFHPRSFELKENLLFMMNLQPEPGSPDLYLTMRMIAAQAQSDSFEHTELECRTVRGIGAVKGFSCVNVPPSELLLINAETLRFTRAALRNRLDQRSESDAVFSAASASSIIACSDASSAATSSSAVFSAVTLISSRFCIRSLTSMVWT